MPQINVHQRLEVINWLVSHNYPVLPVAPAQDVFKHHKVVQTDPKKEIWQNCPLDRDTLQPIALFTGKNPSYLDKDGKPHLVNHRQYQNRLPREKELETWFANPLNGVGTLGGWNNTAWLDFDVKQFPSQQECDAAVLKILERPELQQTFIERSHSGGWRIGVRVKRKPNFTNFSLTRGGNHIGEALGEGRFTVLAPTIGPSGNPYKSINRELPFEVESLESIGIYTTRPQSEVNHKASAPRPETPARPGIIPLELVASPQSREILSGSNPANDRSGSLTAALREWYGWENWGRTNGISFSGNASSLARCTGQQQGIDSDRIERIIDGIDATTCTPAAYHYGGDLSCWKRIRSIDRVSYERLCPDQIKSEIKAKFSQYRGSQPVSTQEAVGATTSFARHQGNGSVITLPTSNGNGSGNGGKKPPTGSGGSGGDGNEPPDQGGKVVTHPAWTLLSPDELLKEISSLIERGLPDSEITLAIPNLAKRAGYTETATWKIYHERLKEVEATENRAETAALVDSLLKARQALVPLHSVLPLALAEPFAKYCGWLNIRPEVVLLTFLTTVSGLHHTATSCWLNHDWDFEVKPNLFTAIVAPPSQKKSPILNRISKKPLRVLERKARDAQKKAIADYRATEQKYNSLTKEQKEQEFPEGLPDPPPARRKIYSFTDTTSEGLRNQIEAYPDQGLIALPDELARLIKSANKYRGGKGSDEEDLLSYYDGGGETVLRADGLAGDFDNLLLGVLGSIQPGVLQKMIKDCHDENGKWARFLFVNQPLAPSVMSADGGSFDLTPMLANLYERVNQLPPQNYKPEREAFAYYCSIYNEFERRRCSESHPGLSAAWGKGEGRIGKLACNLHVVHELMAGRTPNEFIPKARFEEAFAIAMFSMQQVFSLYNELGDENALATHLTKVFTLSQRKGEITARNVQMLYDSKSRPTPDAVRSWFRELEAMNKGKTSGTGRSLSFTANVEFVEQNVESYSTFEGYVNQGLHPNVENVECCGVFSENFSNPDLTKNTVVSELKKSEILSTSSTNSTIASTVEEMVVLAVEDVSTGSSTNAQGSVPDDDPVPDPPGGGQLFPREKRYELSGQLGLWVLQIQFNSPTQASVTYTSPAPENNKYNQTLVVSSLIEVGPECTKWVADLEEEIKNQRLAVARETAEAKAQALLLEGGAVGRRVRILDLRGTASNEEYEVLSWCDRNGFYTLSNGETYYPCQLRLT
jgi:hypothetical protein